MTLNYIDREGNIKELKGEKAKKKLPVKRTIEYTDFGLYLALPILLGILLGSYLGKMFHNQNAFTLGGIILGSLLAFYNLFNLVKKEDGK